MDNFLGIKEPYTAYEKARYVVLPVPFERTTSYGGGTRYGPQAIIDASAYVELYDEEVGRESYITGIHTADTPSMTGKTEEDFARISRATEDILRDGKIPVVLGGEHSISFPVYRAFHHRYEDLSVLQLDAHSDLRYEYGGSVYSHASVMRRIYELNKSIVQVGIRSQCAEEARFTEENGIVTFYAHRLYGQGFGDDIIARLKANVYLTFDVDFFDSSFMPATGTPEPGGFFWPETIAFLHRVFRQRNVVGFDVVELAPVKNMPHADFSVAKLVYKLITLHDTYSKLKDME